MPRAPVSFVPAGVSLWGAVRDDFCFQSASAEAGMSEVGWLADRQVLRWLVGMRAPAGEFWDARTTQRACADLAMCSASGAASGRAVNHEPPWLQAVFLELPTTNCGYRRNGSRRIPCAWLQTCSICARSVGGCLLSLACIDLRNRSGETGGRGVGCKIIKGAQPSAIKEGHSLRTASGHERGEDASWLGDFALACAI